MSLSWEILDIAYISIIISVLLLDIAILIFDMLIFVNFKHIQKYAIEFKR